MDFSFFLSNPLINVGLVSWLVAQGIKTILDAVKHRSFNKQRLAGAGGMPSSHSAVCCSVVLTSYFLYGFQSPVFALAFIVALIVMYDATGVRWAAGLHAKAINQIVEYLDSGDVNDQEKDLNDLIPKLNESLGHRVIEVICGALLGVAIAVIGQLLRQGGAHLIEKRKRAARASVFCPGCFCWFSKALPLHLRRHRDTSQEKRIASTT